MRTWKAPQATQKEKTYRPVSINFKGVMLKGKKFLEKKAAQIRIDLLKMIYEAKTGNTGGSLSCTDILTVLYYSVMKISR